MVWPAAASGGCLGVGHRGGKEAARPPSLFASSPPFTTRPPPPAAASEAYRGSGGAEARARTARAAPGAEAATHTAHAHSLTSGAATGGGGPQPGATLVFPTPSLLFLFFPPGPPPSLPDPCLLQNCKCSCARRCLGGAHWRQDAGILCRKWLSRARRRAGSLLSFPRRASSRRPPRALARSPVGLAGTHGCSPRTCTRNAAARRARAREPRARAAPACGRGRARPPASGHAGHSRLRQTPNEGVECLADARAAGRTPPPYQPNSAGQLLCPPSPSPTTVPLTPPPSVTLHTSHHDGRVRIRAMGSWRGFLVARRISPRHLLRAPGAPRRLAAPAHQVARA